MNTNVALLIFAVASVGVLHTLVPDHWAPIALLARQRAWSSMQTARAAALAGLGHVVTTLLIAIIVWTGGVLVAVRFGHALSLASSIALMVFGAWIAVSAWRELYDEDHHKHGHHHHHHDEHHENIPHERQGSRTALLLILGSSPMIEGIPAFFAAARYGVWLLVVMSSVFAITTITTYVALSVASVHGLKMLRLEPIERYGEILSGMLITLLGLVFLFIPI